MSAIGGPDEHSPTEQPETPEQYSSAEKGSEYDQNYEPEREFVLMPLFRRIGEMLGLRRREELEYVYEPEQSTAVREPAPRAMEAREEIVLPETAIQYSERQLPAENEPAIESAAQPIEQHEELIYKPVEEDVLQLESAELQSAPEPIVQHSAPEVQESVPEPIHAEPQQDFAPASPVGEEISHESLISGRTETPEMEPAHPIEQEWPTSAVQDSDSLSVRKRNPEEIRQLVAPLREAAVKITAIVAQAAEWLRAKEEEFLRSAEVAPAERKREQEIPSAWQVRSSAEALETEIKGGQGEAPTARLERAEPPRIERELRPVPIQFVAKPDRPIVTPAVPFWKRINWADEFTPMRVGILGGLAMAVLLVVGISFARRPASSDLPEQQTRSIQPGGVTVTTHPVAAPNPPRVLRKASTSDRPSSVPQQHRSRSARARTYDDEPEVVVHHYDTAKKPSPVKQTTVAGVRHYSDM